MDSSALAGDISPPIGQPLSDLPLALSEHTSQGQRSPRCARRQEVGWRRGERETSVGYLTCPVQTTDPRSFSRPKWDKEAAHFIYAEYLLSATESER